MVSSSIVPSIRSTEANVNAASPSSLARRKYGLSEETTAPIRSARMSWACSSSTSARYPVYPEMSAIRKQVGWAVESMFSVTGRADRSGLGDRRLPDGGVPMADLRGGDHLCPVQDEERVVADDPPVCQRSRRLPSHGADSRRQRRRQPV